MSEQEPDKEIEAAEPVIEAPKAEPGAEEAAPVGKQFIDFKDLPPEVGARFKRIYGNMKEYERVAQETAKVNRALVDRLDKLENNDFQKRVDNLQAKRQDAWESGDFKKASEYDDELLDYRLAAKERTRAGKPTVEVPEFKPTSDGPLSEDHLASLGAWAKEKDDDGAPVRPWAIPGHPQHARAIQLIQAASMDPDLVSIDSDTGEITEESFRSVLRAVDQRMGGKGESQPAKQKTAAVLSGNGDGRPRSADKSTKLTPEQIRVAENMGYTQKQYAELIQKYGVK